MIYCLGYLFVGITINLSAHKPCYETTNSSWAQATLASLTLREKIGQLFMVAAISSPEQQEEPLAASLLQCPYTMDDAYIKKLITDYKIGGLIFLYKSTPAKQIAAINEYQHHSTVPLLIGQDCEWGLSMRLYETAEFPRNAVLGKLTNKQLIYDLGKEIGRQCKLVGVHINFAPVVDIQNNPNNPVIRDRSFGATPDIVSAAGLLMMQGLQDAGILACAKHFPGHGDTTIDSHHDLPIITHTRNRLDSVELVPFQTLIAHGVAGVMTAHIVFPAIEDHKPATLSSCIVTQLLQQELNFTGLKITDALGMQALTNYYEPGEIELQAFLAGNDILLCPLDVPGAIDRIEKSVRQGTVTEKELDKRVIKILKAKEWAGCNRWQPLNAKRSPQQLTTCYTQQLQKQILQKN